MSVNWFLWTNSKTHGEEIFGREMAYLTSIGKKIENFDMAIGSIALQHKMVMVTDNIDHLGRIHGIEIENWKTDEPKLQ